MKLTYNVFLGTCDINLLVTLLFLFLQMRISYCQDSDSPTTGLYFMLKTEILENSLFFLNIGPQASNRNLSGSTIVCVTTNINTACCRSADNNGMTNATAGAVGEWRYPNGTSVPRLSDNNVMDFARVGFTQQVRLARVVELGSTPPLGVYTCEVPELSTGILHTASITITNGSSEKNSASFPRIATESLTALTLSSITTQLNHVALSTKTDFEAVSTSYSKDADVVTITLSATTSDNNTLPTYAVIAVAIVVAVVGASVIIIVLLLVLIRKKIKNKNSKAKTEPDYYYAKTEAGAEAVRASPQDDYYSNVDKDHASDPNEKDGHYTHVSKELHNFKEANVFQKHDDVADIEVAKKYSHPKASRDEAEDMTQMYSVVDKSAKKKVKHGQEIVNDVSATEGQVLSDMYAVVDKKAVKKSQNRNAFDEYAVVNKSSKINKHSQENTGDLYAVVNKSGKNTSHGHEEVEDDSAIIEENA